MSRHRLLAFTLATFAGISGCASLSFDEQRYFNLYMTDHNVPQLHPRHVSPPLCAIMSLIVPGLGDFYAGEVGWGFFWMTIGLVTWPFGPAIAGGVDAGVANQRYIANDYEAAYKARLQHEGMSRDSDQPQSDRATYTTPPPTSPASAPAPAPPTAPTPPAPPSAEHETSAVRFCSGCGARLDPDGRFCPSCGRRYR